MSANASLQRERADKIRAAAAGNLARLGELFADHLRRCASYSAS